MFFYGSKTLVGQRVGKYPIVCSDIALKQHFQYLWSKRGLLCTLRSRPAVWWNLGSNIGVVASVKSTTETNVTFRDTLKLLMLRPAHIFAFYASRNSKPDDHCRDTKLECTNNAVYSFQFSWSSTKLVDMLRNSVF